MSRQIRGLFVLCLLFTGVVAIPAQVRADTSCSATLSTNSVFVGQSLSLTLRISNTGTNPIVLSYLYKPSAGYAFTGASATGWSADLSDDSRLSIQNGSIPAGESQDFSIQITTDSEPVDGASLNVQASELSDGNGLVDCGTPTFSVIATTAPVIADVTISEVSDSSVKVSWTTDHAASSSLEYGTTSGYGASKSDGTMSTSHALTLTGLSANTTYHAKISGTDSDGFTGTTTDFTFATAAPGLTITQTVTVNTTTTTTNTVTIVAPAATPIPDRTPPKIGVETKVAQVYEAAPEIVGKVTDSGGIDSVEYSTDGGKNWLPVDQDIRNAPKSLQFSFTTSGLSDGNYAVVVRAKDTAGNIAKTKPASMVIDRLSPQIGGMVFSTGPFPLSPTGDGVVIYAVGAPLRLTFSAVGGPTTLNIFLDDVPMTVKQQSDTGLWTAVLPTASDGDHHLRWSAVDGAGNTGEGSLTTLRVLPQGKVLHGTTGVADATVSVYVFEPFFQMFVVWNGAQFGQRNPQQTDEIGAYHITLPAGRYYLTAESHTGDRMRSLAFDVTALSFVTQDFTLRSPARLNLGLFSLPLPDFGAQDTSIRFSESDSVVTPVNPLVGQEFPDLESIGFDVLKLRGKSSIVTICSSWIPLISSHMQVLSTLASQKNVNTLTIMEHESTESVEVFTKRGGYQNMVLADPDGVVGKTLGLGTLPTHFVINRKGIVTHVTYGTMSVEESVALLVE